VKNLSGKRAFVSGSTSGIGAAIAQALAGEGARVVIHGRDAERAARVQAMIADAGGESTIMLAQLDDDADVKALAERVKADYGGIDILVSNAGDAQPFAPDWFSASPEAWLRSYDRNVVAAVRLVHAFVPAMRDRGWGRVILIGSSAYSQPVIDFPAYGPGKAALVNLMCGLSKVLACTGVTVNMISPGAILTETMESNLLPMAAALGWPETDRADIEQRLVTEKWPNSIGRMGRPEEIAAAVAFVASEAAAYMTGANIRLNGGEYPSFH